jgi:phosphoribosylanthranilate isomerase
MDNYTRVKICGLTTLEDARFASGALADYLGFIFFDESPRYIEPAKAGAIINWLEGAKKVGVFVNQALDDVNSIATQTGIDYVQLHGNESPEYCKLIDKPVIKVFRVNDETDPEELNQQLSEYENVAEFFLFDTKAGNQWGGTGKVFDWSVLKELKSDKPYFLSGGLTPGNVSEAIESVKPYAIDLSSGVESAPGLKDFDKIEALFDVLRDVRENQIPE